LLDLFEAAKNAGLRKLVKKHWKYGMGELYKDVVPSSCIHENLEKRRKKARKASKEKSEKDRGAICKKKRKKRY
jgi:hypothetical protein